MGNKNDITKIEGVSEFFKTKVYGDVFKYIRENNLISNPEDVVCQNAFALLDMADALPTVYLSNSIDPKEKEKLITEGIERMYQRLGKIEEVINPPDVQKTKGSADNHE